MNYCKDHPDCEFPMCKCAMEKIAERPKLATVTHFNDGRPPLNDIPARLRLLADELEAGAHGEYENCLVIIPQGRQNADYPIMFGYGSVDDYNNPIITLTLVLQKWIDRVMKRA